MLGFRVITELCHSSIPEVDQGRYAWSVADLDDTKSI